VAAPATAAARLGLAVLAGRGQLARAALWALLALLGLLAFAVVLLGIFAGVGGGGISPAGLPAGARPFLRLYEDAAAVYRVNPFLLMAVHENETDFSRSTLPGVQSGLNFAGCCAGPMQFSVAGTRFGGSGGTWAAYRHASRRARLARPASYPGRVAAPHPSVYDSYDAIYAAAAYFHALGAGPRLDDRTYRALLSYAGTPPASIPYARHDLERARELERLAAEAPVRPGRLPVVPGALARLLPNGLAAAPMAAPPAVRGMVAAANEISDRPYQLRHYPTHLGNPSYDCSSATSHVLWGGGQFGTAPWVSGQFMAYGKPGPGRWVTIYAHTGHVFLYVAGLRFDTSRYDQGPNAPASGPRWRTGPRPLAGFAVRHPAGL
jgi:hypothetical protein